MFETSELFNRGTLLDGKCKLVNTGINAIISHNLCAIETAVGRRERYLDIHLERTRVISCMRTIVDGSRKVRNLHLLQALCRQAC